VKTIVSPGEGVKAGVTLANSRQTRPARAVQNAVKVSAEQLEQEFIINVEAIQTRAETVTTVLESILHSQPILPFNMR
jgi:hypothetical protein